MTDRARAVAATAQPFLPWVGLAAMTGVAAFGNVGPEMMKLLLQWGPGLLIFLTIVQHLPSLVRAQQAQAAANQQQAVAMVSLASELQNLPRRDDMKFQDLLIGQELIIKDLAELKRRIAL